MGFIPIQPSRSQQAPEYLQMDPSASVTLTIGEPVQRVSGTPSQIEAFSGGGTVLGLVGFNQGKVVSGTPEIGTTTPVAVARQDTLYMGQIYDVSESAVATAVVTTHEGNDYGLIEAGGNWYVDEEDETNVHVFVVKVLTELNAVLFRVIASVIADA